MDGFCYFCRKPGPNATVDYCTATGRKRLPSFGRDFDKRYGFPCHAECLRRKLERLAKRESKPCN